jgi:hypothetical protein
VGGGGEREGERDGADLQSSNGGFVGNAQLVVTTAFTPLLINRRICATHTYTRTHGAMREP